MDIAAVNEIIKTIDINYPRENRLYLLNRNGDPKIDINLPKNLDNLIGTVYQVDCLNPNSIGLMQKQSEYYINGRPIVVVCKGTGVYDFSFPNDYETNTPYTGRPFIHQKWDCFTLLKDYYRNELNIDLPDISYFDEWWKKGEDFYMQHSGVAGFYPATTLQKYDVIAMRVNSYVFNHSAIYLGDNKILHHMGGKFSCIEEIRPAYLSFFYGYFRHKDLIANG